MNNALVKWRTVVLIRVGLSVLNGCVLRYGEGQDLSGTRVLSGFKRAEESASVRVVPMPVLKLA